MDVAKYRSLFLEEAGEHLAEMSRALLALEKDPSAGEPLELLFRMAHSIKGMAGSLEYDPITEVAHRLEDRIGRCRSTGGIGEPEELPLWFRALEELERLIGAVRASGAPPSADLALVRALAVAPAPAREPKKKAPTLR